MPITEVPLTPTRSVFPQSITNSSNRAVPHPLLMTTLTKRLNLDLLAQHLLDLLDHLLHRRLDDLQQDVRDRLSQQGRRGRNNSNDSSRGDRWHWRDIGLDEGLNRNGFSRN